MSAGFVHVLALVLLPLAAWAVCATRERDGAVHAIALAAGVAVALVLTVSSLLLMQGWAERMEQFDFTEYSRNERGRAHGQFFAIYFWPYMAAGLGGFAAFVFGRLFYDWVRGFQR